jgi:putative spermidine/putrescine transport system ATP-binding protein
MTGPPGAPALEVRDLAKSFGPVRAVAGLSLLVEPGEFVTLLGPSGSGKTTTLRMIAGFTAPTSGTVLVDGRDVTDLPANRRDIGMVFQNYALFPHMTAGGNVSFPLEMRRMTRADIQRRLREVFTLVGLTGLEDRSPAQLSGGQQQRVALARALVFRPKLLLMDEPLGALDRKLRQGLQAEVRRLQQRLGITTLYVTHDQEEALVMSDRIAVIRDGALQQVGTGDDLYERPRSLFVAEFIGESNIFRGRLGQAGRDLLLSSKTWSLTVPHAPHEELPVVPGGEAAVVVRHEKLAFSPAPQESVPPQNGRIHVAARAISAVRLGAVWKYDFELADGQTVRASVPAGSDQGSTRPGDHVTIHWAPEDCLLLPAEEEGGHG